MKNYHMKTKKKKKKVAADFLGFAAGNKSKWVEVTRKAECNNIWRSQLSDVSKEVKITEHVQADWGTTGEGRIPTTSSSGQDTRLQCLTSRVLYLAPYSFYVGYREQICFFLSVISQASQPLKII